MFKKTFYNEKLTCPECANVILEEIEKKPYVKDVLIDFDNKTITIISTKDLSAEEVNSLVETVSREKQHNSHLANLKSIIIDEYNFDDIDCPNCAAEVEKKLNKRKEVIEAQVDFYTKKIYIKHKDKFELYKVVSKIVKSVDEDAKVEKVDTSNYNTFVPNHLSNNFERSNISCDCPSCQHHKQKESDEVKLVKKILFYIGLIIFAVCAGFHIFGVDNVLLDVFLCISYLFISIDILASAVYGIFHKNIFGESTLMVVASLGSLIMGEAVEAIMVIILYKIGEYFQSRAVARSKEQINSLMNLRKKDVQLVDGTKKDISSVEIGDIVTIKVGESIPLDGIISEGESSFDITHLTGKENTFEGHIGEEVISGAINLTKVVNIEVTKKEKDSTISKIMNIAKDVEKEQAKSEQFITKFSKIYTPCILSIALLVAIIESFIPSFSTTEVFMNAFTILVVSCPCALVISIPLGFYAGIGIASKNGILVRGGNYLEALSRVETVVFDKTGTITKGNFKVTSIHPENGMSEEELKDVFSKVEAYASHPIAEAVILGGKSPLEEFDSIEEIQNRGLKIKVGKKNILVGSAALMDDYNIRYTTPKEIGLVIYVAINSVYCGSGVVLDDIRDEAEILIDSLNKCNINTVLLTGDNELIGQEVAKKLNFNENYCGLSANNKYNKLYDYIKNKKKNVIFVGDDVNDIPSMKLADVGISLGMISADEVKEASDIVIMDDDLNKVSDAIEIAKYTKSIIIQNIVVAILVKVAALLFGIFGWLESYGMVIAIFADSGICVLAVLNTLRILRYKVKRFRKIKKEINNTIEDDL